EVAAGDGRVHVDVAFVLDGRVIVGGGLAVERVAHGVAGHQVADLAAVDVVLAQDLADDGIVAGQRDRGPGRVLAAVHRGGVVRRGVAADRERIASDGVVAVAGQDGVV